QQPVFLGRILIGIGVDQPVSVTIDHGDIVQLQQDVRRVHDFRDARLAAAADRLEEQDAPGQKVDVHQHPILNLRQPVFEDVYLFADALSAYLVGQALRVTRQQEDDVHQEDAEDEQHQHVELDAQVRVWKVPSHDVVDPSKPTLFVGRAAQSGGPGLSTGCNAALLTCLGVFSVQPRPSRARIAARQSPDEAEPRATCGSRIISSTLVWLLSSFCRPMKPNSSTPMMILIHQGDSDPSSVRYVWITPGNSTPMNVPMT